MSLLNDAREYLRIDVTDTSFDGEIQDLIDAAKLDLISVGIDATMVSAETDALIKKAIITYVKAGFGYDTDNMPAFDASYDKIKTKLMNTPDYQGV